MVQQGVSRAAAIAAAIRRELEQRRAHVDAAEDLGVITIAVKLQTGTARVRAVVWTEERIAGTRHDQAG